MEEQTSFPLPGQQNPPTDHNNFPPPGEQNQYQIHAQPSQNVPQQKMEQPSFPPPGQQNPPTDRNNFLPPGEQNPNQSHAQPSQNVPQQNPQYQQAQMGRSMPQQYYQQQGPHQFYQQPVQQMPRQRPPVMNQPMQGGFAMQTVPLNPWSTELFDCAQDMENSIITFFCPCITFGQIAEITDRGMTTCSSTGVIYGLLLGFSGFHWIYSWMYRTRLRTQYSLAEDPCHDCLVHFFCESCAMCQEYRELKHHGFNMQLGWTGNMQMQTQNQAAQHVLPELPSVQGMAR